VTALGEIRRSATTGLLDEGIDQYLSITRTYPRRALRTHLQESESKVSPAPPFAFQSCRNARIGSIRDARRAGAKAATSDTENNRKAVPPTVNASVLPSPYSITRMTRTGWLICGPLNRFSHSAVHIVSPRSQQTHAERFALNQNMLRLPRFLVRLDKGHRLRRRLAKQEALHLVSPQTLNQIELRNGFHSLGNHFHS
jgi:hypothetical protein